ncbi:MAG: DUF4422 domain-containing protein [Lachnospiraceae bacterium]|nr:DUF4422 domain-containing protein [Lachnospiraceae bacterium]
MERKLRYTNETIKQIMDADRIVIYGAGTMGRAVRKCISEEPYMLKPECFIVRSMDDNDKVVDGLPVVKLADALDHRSSLVLVALNGKLMPGAVAGLKAAGFERILPVSFDGDIWTEIRSNWIIANDVLPGDVKRVDDIEPMGRRSGVKLCKLNIYVAHSIYDADLPIKPELKDYESPIHVGAALADKKLFEITDADGADNISEKNRQYCETTGIYLAWKNDTADYVGFSHYRRRFCLDEKALDVILSGNVDVVVTEPILNFASVKAQYGKDHIIDDWLVLMDAISKVAPEYLESAKQVEKGIYYYAYNMFIMKHDIFDSYCRFMFPVLEYCVKRIGKREDIYQNRYAGFLAERLLTIFLNENRQYTVAIADKKFIE